MYSSTLSSTLALDWSGWSASRPGRFAPPPPRERPGTHCIAGWVGLRAGLDRCGQKYCRLFYKSSRSCGRRLVEASWNVMAHAQKPDFVFRRNGRVHLNQQGASVQSTTGSRGMRISGSNAGYTMFRGSVKSTGYSLHSPVSPSLPLPCVTVCHHISTGVWLWKWSASVFYKVGQKQVYSISYI
jgi:hypothetical protein